MTAKELRTLVAEKVLGARVQTRVFGQRHLGNRRVEEWWQLPDASYLAAKEEWNPLESWADAGRVYDSILARGWLVTTAADGTGRTTCIVTDGETYRELTKVCGRDWKEAISLAALRALGVEVE